MESTTTSVRFIRIAPALPVPDVRIAAEYYRDHLGFTVTDLMDQFAMLERDDMKLQFWRGKPRGGMAQRDQNPGLRDVGIWVEDVDMAHKEFVATGLPVLEEPEDVSYGLRHEMYQDLNDYVILDSGPVIGKAR